MGLDGEDEVKHVVEVSITINSHAEQDERMARVAMQQGMPVPYGPVVCQKIAKFGSEGTTLPEATQDAVEALVAYCQSEGISVLPGASPIPAFPRPLKGQ